jgi:hypothetical protein
MSRRPFLLAGALVATTCLAPSARAQTASSSSGSTGTGTENINSPIPNPNRFLLQNGQYVDVTNNPRPQNLNPTGCNFLDCEQDLQLQFPITYSGFGQGDQQHIEVWAGTVDCTQDNNRTGTGVPHLCWKVNQGTGPLYATSAVTATFTVFARDVLRYEQPGNTMETWDPNFHSSSQGETACHVQTSDAMVPITIYFIPVDSTGSSQNGGTAYKWTLNADLVAPPAPTDVGLNPGDTLLQVTWTSPGNDPDIVGYAVWSDPPAGGSTTGGCTCGSTPGGGANSYIGGDAESTLADATQLVCPDTGVDSSSATDGPSTSDVEEAGGDADLDAPMAPETMAEASTDGGTDASPGGDSGKGSGIDSGSAAPDASTKNCTKENSGGGGACASFNLTGRVTTVGGGSTTTTTGDAATDVFVPVVTGDETTSTGAEGGVTLSGGGISQIDPKFKAGEIDDITATQLTLTGLTNGLNYVVVVTTIDGSGNVGPISEPPNCKQPEPTDDYWKTYKKDGGGATGCALGGGPEAPVFAVGIIAAAAGLARRRRRR